MWLPKENKYARKSLRTRSEATAIEKGKAAYLEIYANLQQGKSYFSITTKEGVEKYLSFRMRDVELGHIVKGRHTTIATHLQHFLSFIGKDTKLKELERTDCENYFYHRHKATNGWPAPTEWSSLDVSALSALRPRGSGCAAELADPLCGMMLSGAGGLYPSALCGLMVL